MDIDGRGIAKEILDEILIRTKSLKGLPRLAAVLIGDNPDSRKFLELKKNAAKKCGIDCRIYQFPENITTQQLRKQIVSLAKTDVNDGIIIELPLPRHINTQYALNAVPPEKDPDVLSEKGQAAFYCNRSNILPPSVEAVKIILAKNQIELRGKNCCVFGYGILVGKPVAHWLASQGASVSIVNEFTSKPGDFSCLADIVVSGTGEAGIITAEMIKQGAVVIDFAQDCDFESVSKKAALVTPPVGGAGPIVVATVLKNLISLHGPVHN